MYRKLLFLSLLVPCFSKAASAQPETDIDSLLDLPFSENELKSPYNEDLASFIFGSTEIEPVKINDEVEHFFSESSKTVNKKLLRQLKKKNKASESPAKKTPKKKLYLTCPFPECNVHCTKAKNLSLFAHLQERHNLQTLLEQHPHADSIAMKHGVYICTKCKYAAKCKSTFSNHQDSQQHLRNNK